jgi:glycerophosphoryl diester phosphodiesterase
MPVSARLLGRNVTVLTPGLVELVHRAGKLIHIWTVDDSEEMVRLIDAGVDGIFTDRIDTLKAVLQARSLWYDGGENARPGPGALDQTSSDRVEPNEEP